MVETAQYENLTDTGQSSEEIRQNIVAQEEKISETVEEVSERLKETLDWRQYIGNYPYLSLGIAAGLGYLTSRLLPEPPTTMEKISGAIGEIAGNRVGNFFRGSRGNLIIEGLKGLALTIGAGLAKQIVTQAILGGGDSSSARRTSNPQPESASRQGV